MADVGSNTGTTGVSNSGARLGSYRILEPLGSGGMSSVFRAEHLETGHEVAVKVLPRSLAKNATMLQRFLREAKNVEALDHPNIVAIFDRGSEQGRHYLVLEYLHGGDLHERTRKGLLAINDVVEIAVAVSHALRYAASRNVIHRDIKPANLLMTTDGYVKVTDFGLALQVEDDDERVTRDGTTVGTVDYMAPEQARDSRAATIRSDMYSLGCTLYYLLVGHAPFAGGDIAEKLSKHCNETPKDPRVDRPEISESFAQVILKLLAKRPEQRYVDYDALLVALQPLRASDSAEDFPDVMVDDGPVVVADASWVVKSATPRDPNASTLAAHPRELSLGELVEADDENEPVKPRSAPVLKRRPPVTSPAAELDLAEVEDGRDEIDESVLTTSRSDPERQRPGVSVSAVIGIGLAIGLFVGLVAFGVRQIYLVPSVVVADAELESATTAAPPGVEPVAIATRIVPIPQSAKVTKPQPKQVEPIPPVRWVEPIDNPPIDVAERVFDRQVETRLVPEWAKAGDFDQVEGPIVTVDRLEKLGDKNRVTTLRRALDTSAGTIEIIDNGPYFEKDFEFTGKARHIRAAIGHRTIVKIEPRDQPVANATTTLDSKRLILERLDLLIDTRELSQKQTALFALKASELILRDCTITVRNKPARPFVIVQIGDEPRTLANRGSRVVIDRSLIRGHSLSILNWGVEAADVVLSRSVILGGAAPLLTLRGSANGLTRRIALTRSLLAGQGSLLELGGPLIIRSLGTTYSRVEPTHDRTCLIGVDAAADAVTWLDWAGEGNTFTGWSALVLANGGSPRAADLGAMKIAWPGGDVTSVERAEPWPEAVEMFSLADLEKLAPEQKATLARVATPNAWLREHAQTSFSRLPVPPLALQITDRPAVPTIANPKADPNQLDVTFNTQVAPWFGDLGAFLKQVVAGRPNVKLIKVRAQGFGPRTSSPIKLPEGISLELVVDAPATPGGETLSWTTPTGVIAPALIEVRGGDLTLVGVRLIRDETSRPMHLVRVERGHLVMVRCKFTAPGKGKLGGGGLIEFQASGSQPLPPRSGPFASANDRPTCLAVNSVFVTGGVAIKGSLARGVIKFVNCVLAVGGTAFSLFPEQVRGDRFEADLQLDRCSIASEDAFVMMGPWPGIASGPVRPWLISSHGCVFLDTYNRSKRTSILLKADAKVLAAGGVIWQADGDAYELTRFLTNDGARPPDVSRPDIRRQWMEFWGTGKIQNVSGPLSNRLSAVAKPMIGRLVLGDVQPGDLALDPSVDPDKKIKSIGVDWSLLEVTPSVPQQRSTRRR